MTDYPEVAPGVVQVPVLGAQVWLLVDGPLTLVDTGTRGSGRAIRVDAPLADGDPLPGRADARLVHLPGHTPGSSAVYLPERSVVLAGDAFEARGRLAPPN